MVTVTVTRVWVKKYTTAHTKLRELINIRCENNVSSNRKWFVNVLANREGRQMLPNNRCVKRNQTKSNGGEIMESYNGFMVDEDCNIYNEKTGNKLTPHLGSDGYMQVIRRDERGKL